MKYRNKKTGQIIEVRAYITGGNWEPMEAPRKPVEAEPEEKTEKKAGKKK